MSKLDELMGLVHGYARLYWDDRMSEEELSRRDASRAALQDALKAVVEDAERLDWLDGEYERERQAILNHRLMPDSLFRANLPITRAAIDAARKP